MNYKLKNAIKRVLFRNEAGHKIYVLISSVVKANRKNLSDEEFLKQTFKENTGKELNLENPTTFNDKLLWLSLNDRNPLKTKCADKVAVREYVEEKGYKDILNQVYGIYDSIDQIEFDKMPQKFFVKTNHDSGTYVLVDKNDMESKKGLRKIEKALKKNYYYESREWQYKDIVPKIICEKYIETNDPLGLVDYRFYCFNGKVGFVAVDVGTTSSDGKHAYVAKRNLYSKDFKLLDAKLKRDHFDSKLIKKPDNYNKMIEIAEKLSEPFKHVRVDFYNVNGKIIFGELTFCNAGGMQLLEPENFNICIGSMLDIR